MQTNKENHREGKFMCISFEKVSGKKVKGNCGLLNGLTKTFRDVDYGVAIVRMPVEIMDIDTRYQTEIRTERDLRYLTSNWNEQKLLPLIGVPHWEEGKVYIVDGYGRWIASQIVDKEKYKDLSVQLILNAPQEKRERLEFEAEMYAYQNKQVAKMTAIQKHGAMIVLHDEPTKVLEKMKKRYGFEYTSVKGNREASVLGSYTETLSLCKIDNGKAAEYVFDICEGAGFDRKSNGYATYIMRGLKDMYKLYSNDRKETKEYLSKELRMVSPMELKANADVKYPTLEMKTAVSLYLEDMIVRDLKLSQSREVDGTKVVPIKKAV
jgi:hypothetical protein